MGTLWTKSLDKYITSLCKAQGADEGDVRQRLKECGLGPRGAVSAMGACRKEVARNATLNAQLVNAETLAKEALRLLMTPLIIATRQRGRVQTAKKLLGPALHASFVEFLYRCTTLEKALLPFVEKEEKTSKEKPDA